MPKMKHSGGSYMFWSRAGSKYEQLKKTVRYNSNLTVVSQNAEEEGRLRFLVSLFPKQQKTC